MSALCTNVTVIRIVQRSRASSRPPRGECSKLLNSVEAMLHEENQKEARQERRRLAAAAVAKNAALPRHAGALRESRHSLLGGNSDQLRWVVLEPAAASLSIWERPPAEDAMALMHKSLKCSEMSTSEEAMSRKGSGTSASEGAMALMDFLPQGFARYFRSTDAPPKAPRKVYSMRKLVDVDANPAFRNIFLRFEGTDSVLCLTAEEKHEFEEWMNVLRLYQLDSEDNMTAESLSRTPSPPCMSTSRRSLQA